MLSDRLSAVLDEPEVNFEDQPMAGLDPETEYPSIAFQLLEPTGRERKRWWTSFGAGTVILAVIILTVLILTAVIPSVVKAPFIQHRYVTVYLTLPPLPRTTPVPKPVVTPPVRRAAVEPPLVKAPAVAPKSVFQPQIPTRLAVAKPVAKPTFERPKIAAPKTQFAAMVPAVPKWTPKIAMGKFATRSPSAPTTPRAARSVQTGGFGKPAGLAMEARDRLPGNTPKLGTFGLPDGPGHGNGSGGAYGTRGVVASAGFGEAGSSGSGTGVAGRPGTVQAGGFGDAGDRASARAAQPRQVMAASSQGVVILSKPDPAYTEDARRQHIQGQVVLEVVFTASGDVRVVRVVKGLGHGLDQSAVDDAREIRFRPAQRGGAPVDTPAVLRILFELAS
ncbi:MAG: energy transducer TonB [Terriglobia bacterium]